MLLLLLALSSTPLLTADLVEEAGGLSARLRAAVAATPPDVDAAEALMTRAEVILDAYFHAPNLKAEAARPLALRLRPIIHDWISGPTPIVALSADALRFRPALHRRLAEAHEAAGRLDAARRHRAEVLAVITTRADLAAWDALERGLGRTSKRAEAWVPRP
ncbi:hypothetical protein KKF91_03655 [Myxococcota bacterium]|nr:hypothetical protein [Myxococcota bacterium]MBU1429638.1 hypothetical protein [Myxococcota bacterium]MBU1899727.1 hypothetical protein [Myxococcota bacterium]